MVELACGHSLCRDCMRKRISQRNAGRSCAECGEKTMRPETTWVQCEEPPTHDDRVARRQHWMMNRGCNPVTLVYRFCPPPAPPASPDLPAPRGTSHPVQSTSTSHPASPPRCSPRFTPQQPLAAVADSSREDSLPLNLPSATNSGDAAVEPVVQESVGASPCHSPEDSLVIRVPAAAASSSSDNPFHRLPSSPSHFSEDEEVDVVAVSVAAQGDSTLPRLSPRSATDEPSTAFTFASSSASRFAAWLEKPVSSNASTDGGDDVGAGGVDTEEGHLPIPWSEKHRQLRDLIPWLIEHHFSGSLREMARSIGWERMTISRYLSGKTCRGHAMDPVKL